jgi:single-strand DNA-binding protein
MTDTTVTLVGNTTRDAEVRTIKSGAAVAEFGVAVNKRVKGEDGQWEDGQPEFYDVTLWGSSAENFAQSCPRGTRVLVHGRLQYDTWETPEGEKRSKVKVVADHVGPELRWATAEVTKTAKGEGSKPKQAARQNSQAYEDGMEEPF